VMITESAVWYLYFFHCPEKDSGIVKISGTSEWKNSYGYLDGSDYALLLFSFLMSIVYGCLLLVWTIIVLIRRKNLLLLQSVGGVILFMGLLEMTFMYLSMTKTNEDGHENSIMSAWALLEATIGVFKQTLSRLALLLLMLGYSIERMRLSRPTIIFMAGISLGYLVSSLSYSLIKISPALKYLTPIITEIIQFPGVMFNLICFGWYFVASYNTMQNLREHKELWKVDRYHKSCIVLAISLLLGVLVSLTKGTGLILQWNDTWWQVWWLWDVYWDLSFIISFVFIIIIWKPLPDNKLYHISEEAAQSESNEQNNAVPQNGSEESEINDSERDDRDTVRLLEISDDSDVQPLNHDEESLI